MDIMTKNLPAKTDNFESRLATMRAKAGLAQPAPAGPVLRERKIRLRCAVSGEYYDVAFTRPTEAERFTIARYDREGNAPTVSLAGRLAAALPGGRAPRDEQFRAADFDLSGWACPCCGDGRGFVICSACASNVCKGRTRDETDGRERFNCHPSCGESFPTGVASTIGGTSGKKPGSRATLGGPKPKAITAPLRRITHRK
jgi:hypothetical protein